MAPQLYVTLDGVRSIVDEQIPEGVNLEYKSSSILVRRDAEVLCKVVSAFANSTGGTFIIGIETKDEVPIRVDDGTPGASRRDWIFQVINGGTFPAVEVVDIREIPMPTGTIYIVDVPVSPQAPHQSRDHKYYKRRGSHSEVMEHYEIEDVRNRPKRARSPLIVDLQMENILAYLRLANESDVDTITDLRCEIESNFTLDRGGLDPLRNRGLRALLPRSELHFIIGSAYEILQTQEPVATFRFNYLFHGARMAQSITLHFADLNHTAILKAPGERALEDIGKKLENVADRLERLQQTAERLSGMVDGTGLRLSHRTLRALKDAPQLFEPTEFDSDGYNIIADISHDDAMSLSRLFHYFSSEAAKSEYEKLSDDVRTRFEKYFKVSFD